MKASMVGLTALAAFAPVVAEEGSPIAKVIQMISDLQAKVIGEGEVSQKEYDEFAEWCEEQSKNLQFEIKTGTSTVEELTATIASEAAKITELTSTIEDLAAEISKDEAELKAATDIRNKENADFVAEEKELVDTIDTLSRALQILEREMAKGASMMQLKNAGSITEALKVLKESAAFNSADASRLTALVQSSSEDDTDADSLGAPAPDAYKNQSGGIVDTLGDLKEKGETQLDEARKKEQNALNKFQMVQQSLTDSIGVAKKNTAEAKKSKAQSEEKKGVAEGDLDVSSKDLAEDTKALGGLHQDCMTKAEDVEAETKSRAEELAALAKANEIIIEATGGAASFLQVSEGAKSAGVEAVRVVRSLAQKHHSQALAQLASRMSMKLRAGSGADVFAKVKALIGDMIEKLNEEAEADATEKAFCDKELAEANAKKEEKETLIKKLSTKIDQATDKSAKLKQEVSALQKELSDLEASQIQMDKMRQEENAAFVAAEAETSKGLKGIRLALKTLKDYYAKADSSSEGAAGGIVSLLEVCESDFSKTLAELKATEESAASEYDKETKENDIEKTTKEQDVKYKTKESVGLEKSASEMKGDVASTQDELDAVLEGLKQLEDRCIAKAPTYEELKAKRDAEIAGLKDALEILDGEAVLLQRSSLRGVHRH